MVRVRGARSGVFVHLLPHTFGRHHLRQRNMQLAPRPFNAIRFRISRTSSWSLWQWQVMDIYATLPSVRGGAKRERNKHKKENRNLDNLLILWPWFQLESFVCLFFLSSGLFPDGGEADTKARQYKYDTIWIKTNCFEGRFFFFLTCFSCNNVSADQDVNIHSFTECKDWCYCKNYTSQHFLLD